MRAHHHSEGLCFPTTTMPGPDFSAFCAQQLCSSHQAAQPLLLHCITKTRGVPCTEPGRLGKSAWGHRCLGPPHRAGSYMTQQLSVAGCRANMQNELLEGERDQSSR